MPRRATHRTRHGTARHPKRHVIHIEHHKVEKKGGQAHAEHRATPHRKPKQTIDLVD